MKRLTLALLLLAACGSARPAQVIPSGSFAAAEMDPERTGAPSPTVLRGLVLPVQSPSGAPTPRPSGGLGDATSYFKPTPRPAGVSGQATWWFSFGHGLYAAIRPDLGTKGDLAIVCGGEPFHCLSLPVTTTCACLGPGSRRLIDLSKDAFESFADPSVGTIRVSLQVVKAGAP